MDARQHGQVVNFIWNIADDVLRGALNRTKYRDVILPMTVIRRLDALLEPTKLKVLDTWKMAEERGISERDGILQMASGHPFYNASPFTLRSLTGNPKNIHADMLAYLDGYSRNVRDILDRFNFHGHLRDLDTSERLGLLIEKFVSPSINLSPNPHGGHPGLDNHAMGTVFEELLRRFNEQNNEEAGEHFTPRDVVNLMADLAVIPVANQLRDSSYLVYDGACGTGGMLSVSKERIVEIAHQRGYHPNVRVYGQELNPETWAIAQADQLVQDQSADTIKLGSTLGDDKHPTTRFEFMISNPPYGVSWKADQDRLGGKGKITDPRFIIQHDGDPEYSLLTRSSDGQLLFLANMISKMKHETPLGSRIAEIHNGSSLFTGDAGQGESNIRRWIIENDWLEAIIALPNNMFYNTGIATYIWVLTNRKPEHRKGKVQLIDATRQFTPRRKNLGAKNADLSDANQQAILDEFLAFKESETSKIFPNKAFGYRKVTVERPLRLRIDIPAENPGLPDDLWRVVQSLERDPTWPRDAEPGFWEAYRSHAKHYGVRPTATHRKQLRAALGVRDDTAQAVVVRSERLPYATGNEGDHLHGQVLIELGGKPFLNEYEPDPEGRDTEQIPLTEDVAAFVEREVWPHVPDAWVAPGSEKIGYEISFTRYFYKPKQVRTLAEIEADIRALETETVGLLEEILVDVTA